jgi:hypothetical protein
MAWKYSYFTDSKKFSSIYISSKNTYFNKHYIKVTPVVSSINIFEYHLPSIFLSTKHTKIINISQWVRKIIFFIIHLLTCEYIGWVISLPCPPPHLLLKNSFLNVNKNYETFYKSSWVIRQKREVILREVTIQLELEALCSWPSQFLGKTIHLFFCFCALSD